jgi:hypothetical protein
VQYAYVSFEAREAAMTALVHCIYSSRAVRNFTFDEVKQLLETVRAANARREVSGMLLYSGESFFQVLEGDPEVIDALFEKISKDPRHCRVTRIIREPIPRRFFGEWSMGYAEMEPAELGGIEGLNDFFVKGQCLAEIDFGRSRKVLEAFRAGRWRERFSANQTSAVG